MLKIKKAFRNTINENIKQNKKQKKSFATRNYPKYYKEKR